MALARGMRIGEQLTVHPPLGGALPTGIAVANPSTLRPASSPPRPLRRRLRRPSSKRPPAPSAFSHRCLGHREAHACRRRHRDRSGPRIRRDLRHSRAHRHQFPRGRQLQDIQGDSVNGKVYTGSGRELHSGDIAVIKISARACPRPSSATRQSSPSRLRTGHGNPLGLQSSVNRRHRQRPRPIGR